MGISQADAFSEIQAVRQLPIQGLPQKKEYGGLEKTLALSLAQAP